MDKSRKLYFSYSITIYFFVSSKGYNNAKA